MAEFCFKCWNKMHHNNYSRWDVKLSRGLDLCEGCGEWQRIVLEKRYINYQFVFVDLIGLILEEIILLLLYPFRYHQRKKRRPK